MEPAQIEKLRQTIDATLQTKIKVVGDGEHTYHGTPLDLIIELSNALEALLDQDRTRLLEQVLEVAPEKTVYPVAEALRAGTYKRGQEQWHDGFNKAIDQYKANITNLLTVKEQ